MRPFSRGKIRFPLVGALNGIDRVDEKFFLFCPVQIRVLNNGFLMVSRSPEGLGSSGKLVGMVSI